MRYLVLGSNGHGRQVEAHTWDQLPADLNIADFDRVVLDFVPFEEDEELARGIDPARLPSTDQFARLLFSGAEVIAIGNPSTVVGGGTPVVWWLPMQINVVAEAGEIRNVDYPWEAYFEHTKHYSWYFDHLARGSNVTLRYALNALHPNASGLAVDPDPIARTRFDKGVAVKWALMAVDLETYVGENRYQGLRQSGPIIWLPGPENISHGDAVDLLLRERYEIALETREPDWLAGFVLPREVPMREEAQRNLDLAQTAYLAYTQATERATTEGRFKKLLYETGEDALEPVVRDALRALHAIVNDPETRGREDGTIIGVPGHPEAHGTLEVKGRRGSLKLSDVRELDQWVRDQLPERESKGILIACLRSDDQPHERHDLFPPNCVDLAEKANIALVTSTQLFEALRRHQLGELDLPDFFASVFAAAGLAELPEPEEPPGGAG
jgi:hypothetical protein